jgi:hypothetical protein
MQRGKRYPTSCFHQDIQVIYSVLVCIQGLLTLILTRLTTSVRELHIFKFHPKCVFTNFLVNNNNIIHSLNATTASFLSLTQNA